MVVQASGSFIIDAVSAVQGAPSLSRPGRFVVQFSGVPDITAFSVVIGETVADVPPATFGALSNTSVYTIDQLTTAQYQIVGGTSYTGSATLVGAESGDPGWTVGRFAWICLFPIAIPVGGSVPSKVIRGGIIVA